MHEPGELPDFTNEGFMASPGFSTVCRVDVRQVNGHKPPGYSTVCRVDVGQVNVHKPPGYSTVCRMDVTQVNVHKPPVDFWFTEKSILKIDFSVLLAFMFNYIINFLVTPAFVFSDK